MPNDGGHLILTDEEKAELLGAEPDARKFIRPFVGAQEFINGERRWCLWLMDASPAEIRAMPEVMRRVEAGAEAPQASKRQTTTRELAETPTLFGEIRQPDSRVPARPVGLLRDAASTFPLASCRRRVIASNLVLFVPGATRYHFGVLVLRDAHGLGAAGLRAAGVRLPLLEQARVQQLSLAGIAEREAVLSAVEAAAQAVLDAREEHLTKGATLADLYDPLAMPRRAGQSPRRAGSRRGPLLPRPAVYVRASTGGILIQPLSVGDGPVAPEQAEEDSQVPVTARGTACPIFLESRENSGWGVS